MSQYVETPTKAFVTGEAIGQHLLVITPGALVVCTLGADPIGTTEQATFASGAEVAVRLRSAQGTHKGVAADSFSAGAVVYAAAAGKLTDLASGAIRVGIALEAAGADGDIVEWMPCG